MIRIHPYSLPLKRPFQSSLGSFSKREGVLVSVQSGSHQGWGEAAPLPGLSIEKLSEAQEELGALERTSIELPQRLAEIGPWVETHCQTASARFALATGILDAMGQRENKPISTLLTPVPNQEIPISHLYSNDEHLLQATMAGSQTIKMKVGIEALDIDIERVKHVRSIIGPDIPIRVDANGAWTEAQATMAIQHMAPLGVTSMEEPVANRNLAVMARLRNRGIHIAADESVRSQNDLDRIISVGAADAIVIKPMLIGTPMQAIDMIHKAHQSNLKIWVTTTIDGAIARMMAVHIAAAVPKSALAPCGLNTAGWLKTDIGQTPDMSGSHIDSPRKSGLGIQVQR